MSVSIVREEREYRDVASWPRLALYFRYRHLSTATLLGKVPSSIEIQYTLRVTKSLCAHRGLDYAAPSPIQP